MAGVSPDRRTYDTGVALSRAMLPEPPPRWSYSSLRDVETCPRRYVLARADYPELSDRHGYPRLSSPAVIKGDVVHRSLEVILTAMVRAGCPSTRSPEAVAVLRELGGYTVVAESALEGALARLGGNPRIDADRREQLTRTLRDWIPRAREQVQTYLGRMALSGVTIATSGPGEDGSTGPEPRRRRAEPGDHPELELVAADLRLTGRVDLLRVACDGASITDFKTGKEDPVHRDQLRTYALLWQADTTANPDALPVTALVASYPSHEVAVPVPDAAELAQLASETTARIATADRAVVSESPSAVVGEQCGLCGVRVLCDAYWERRAARISDVADGEWFDFEGAVIREHGVKSWMVRESATGCNVLVRTPSQSVTLPVGERVRILGARRTIDPDDEGALIASLSSMSETQQLTS